MRMNGLKHIVSQEMLVIDLFAIVLIFFTSKAGQFKNAIIPKNVTALILLSLHCWILLFALL